MDENDRRNIEDFYAHRALVLKNIQRALEREKQLKNRRPK